MSAMSATKRKRQLRREQQYLRHCQTKLSRVAPGSQWVWKLLIEHSKRRIADLTRTGA